MAIYLLRHGQTAWNVEGRFQGQTNIPLNEEGQSQADTRAAYFDSINLTAVYSSGLERSFETAQRVIRYRHEVIRVPDLNERGFGILEGKTEAYLREAGLSERVKERDFKPENGESRSEARERIVKGFMRTIKGHYYTDEIVVVGHKGVNAYILGATLGREKASELGRMGNCCGVVLRYDQEWILEGRIE